MTRSKHAGIVVLIVIVLGAMVLTGCGTTGSSAQNPTPNPNPQPSTTLMSATPGSSDFGQVAVGSTASRSVTLTNTGNANVIISAANVTGSGFSVFGLALPRTVTPGATATASIRFTPSAAGSASGSVSFVSDASNSPAVVNLSGSGFTPIPHFVDLSWNSSTSTVSGYRVYRSTQSGGAFQPVSTALIPGLSFTDSSVVSGQTYFYVVTAVDSQGAESTFSNQASAAIPIP